MDQLAESFAKHRRRLKEIVDVLGRYGFADWANRGAGIPGVKLAQRVADPELSALTAGERLRGAATELGTTFIKFAQMLSLRPDLVGADVAAELEQLQGSVAPDPPEAATETIVKELGARSRGCSARSTPGRWDRAPSPRSTGQRCMTAPASSSRCSTKGSTGRSPRILT
jgi:predicted unusual protein kinase regulating ubiquinone biosynthesis (AarF/ABC1/UbiB family)